MLHNVTKQPEKSTEEVMKGTDVETTQGLANSVFNKQQHNTAYRVRGKSGHLQHSESAQGHAKHGSCCVVMQPCSNVHMTQNQTAWM